jgi:phage terminase small subunit
MPALENTNHEAFAQHYAMNGHATAAGLSIGVMHKSKAWAIRHRKEVDARIHELVEQRFSKANITAERTMKELARIAFADIRDLYDEQGDLLPVHMLSDDVAATVSRIEVEIAAKEQIGEDEDGNPTRKRTMVVTKKIRQSDKMAALALLARHFKIVGDEGDGMNALANALADRLKSARRREHLAGPAEDAVYSASPPAALGQRLEYGLGDDPSNANDVSTPRLVVPTRDPNALHSALPVPQQQRGASPQGAPREDELW